MSAAGVSFLVVVMVALEVGTGRECSGEIGLDRRLRVAGNAADHFDPSLGKCRHRAAADTGHERSG